ncbi:MAG: C10 family peptidase [Prevotella sp.]|nr:C10 family peptidase [Prevotella sp.]
MTNKRNHLLLLLIAMVLPATVLAAPRAKEQMRQAAQQAFAQKSLRKARLQPARELQELRSAQAYSIYGYPEGGFVVVSADDRLPAVVGYSSSQLAPEGQNPNFQWWLSQVEQAVQAGYRASQVKPDPNKFPDHVDPMVTAKWGQEAPYNLFTPVDADEGCTLTGCVAVAMSQVMHHWRYPYRGQGQNTVYYPYWDLDNAEAYTVNFSLARYDWDQMLDVYKDATYSQEQAEAMATLMYHCGVACYMQYGTEFSGAYMQRAAEGLRKYFGYPLTVKNLSRNSYESQQTWMEILFNELANSRPVIYGGDDRYYGGHAFVIDGYDSEGYVSVNWGWEGKEDGFYDISLLNPSGYSFKEGHEMIIGIVPESLFEPKQLDLTLARAGQLTAQIGGDDEKYAITELKVRGPLNSDDIRTLREMAGRTATNMGTRGLLYKLDLSEASIVSGGEPYFIDDSEQSYTTTDDALPEHFLANCEGISSLVLPASLKHFGAGAFAYCYGLDEVTLPEAPAGVERDFTVDDRGLVVSVDGKEVIGVLPTDADTLRVPEGVEQLRPYALAGDVRHERVVLPSTLVRLGTHSMDNENLTFIKIYAKTTPRMAESVFGSLIQYYCMLYVPAGCKTAYSNAEQWKTFRGTYYYNYWGYTYDNIREFGAHVKARNAARLYGQENPELGYQISGAMIHGEPIVSCEATPQSPVGRYPILISKGTVSDENVEFEDGYLNVLPAPLTARAKDCTRYQGQLDREPFEVEYEGLLFNDTEADFYEKPVVTTAATNDSPVGTYELTVSGGDARNYDFEYATGTLTIIATPAAIQQVAAAGSQAQPLRNLQGQRIAAPRHPGIYIEGGRKIVIKR